MRYTAKTIFLTFSFLVIFISGSFSQVTQVWEARWRDFSGDYNSSSVGIAIDKWQNIYAVGYTLSPYNNFVAIKYNSSGTQLWVKKYYGQNDSVVFPTAMGIDSSGNVFITGYINSGMSSDNIITVKFNTLNGDILWAKTYKAPNNWGCGASGLSVDKYGNAYLVGGTSGKYSLVIKYNPQGDTLWTQVNYFNASYLNDCTIDDSCDLYATGYNDAPNPVGSHSFTLKYSSDGILRWTKSYTDSSSTNNCIAVDGMGNCYSGGGIRHTGGGNLILFKYDTNGNLQWTSKYIMPIYREAQSNKLFVNKAGTFIVSGGAGTFTSRDCLTIGFNAITGDTNWTRIYDGTGHDYDEINDVVMDKYNNVYVTGYSIGSISGEDYLTIKYSLSGQQLGLIKYNYFNGLDIAKGIVIDTNLNVYVSGFSWDGIVNYITTLKYANFVNVNPSGTQFPSLFILYQNFPNPFNPTTTIEYELAKKSYVILSVFDILGKKIEVLVNEVKEQGKYYVKFDAGKYSSGIYFYSLSVGNIIIDTKKLIVIK